MKTIRYWVVHYVNREDPGDLLWGFNWREAVWVDDGTVSPLTRSYKLLEANMFDKETGKNVGDTRDYCLNPRCTHEDCAAAVVIAEVPLLPCYCGNFGDDGPDDLCDRICEKGEE